MNVFSHPRFRLGWILIVIGLLNALGWTAYRWHFENSNNHAQITLDFEDTRALADAYTIPQAQLLRDLHKRGAVSIAVYNQTIGSLRDNGRLTVSPRESAQQIYPRLSWDQFAPDYRYLITSTDPQLITQIFPRLLSQTPPSVKPLLVPIGTGEGILVSNSRQQFNDVQVGYDPQQLKIARAEGYGITARLSNPLNLTPERLNLLLDDVKNTGAHVVVFGEDEVLGYQSLIAGAAREMRKRDLIFTNVEFGKQAGSPDFALNTDGEIARLHTVTAAEATRAKTEVLVDRFVRAAKERNMRVLYLRLIRQQKGEPTPVVKGEEPRPLALEKTAYQQNLDFVEEVSTELKRQALPLAWIRPGFVMADAQPFGDYPLAPLSAQFGAKAGWIIRYGMIFMSGLAVVGATLLILNLFFDLSEKARRNWLFLGLAMIAALSLSTGKGAQLIALQAGLMFPLVAIVWGGLPLIWDGLKTLDNRSETPSQIAWFGFKILVRTTLLTIIGGFLVVALLNGWKYMSKADEFLGEKATQFIPLLLVPIAFAGEMFPHRVAEHGAAPGQARLKARFARVLAQPFTVRIAFTSIVLLFVGYIWMARFGNESGMEISPLELQLRATLEKVFITRPRTKEIFMGHPAFLVAVMLMLRRQKMLAWGALALATIGQTDVFNSMCHIHTPVFYCIWRSVTGVFIGGFVGWITLWVWEKIAAKLPKSAVAKALEPEETKSLNFTF